MAVVNLKGKLGSMQIWGKLGRPGLPDPAGIAGIYKRRKTRLGVEIIKMHFYQPTGLPSDSQVAQRAKLRTAVIAWQALPTDEKKHYNKLSRNYQMTGFNLFLSRYMKTL